MITRMGIRASPTRKQVDCAVGSLENGDLAHGEPDALASSVVVKILWMIF